MPVDTPTDQSKKSNSSSLYSGDTGLCQIDKTNQHPHVYFTINSMSTNTHGLTYNLHVHSRVENFNCGITDIWGQVVLLWELCCVLWDAYQHLWPLPNRYQQHATPSPMAGDGPAVKACSFLTACSTSFLIEPRSTTLRMAIPTMGWVPLINH